MTVQEKRYLSNISKYIHVLNPWFNQHIMIITEKIYVLIIEQFTHIKAKYFT